MSEQPITRDGPGNQAKDPRFIQACLAVGMSLLAYAGICDIPNPHPQTSEPTVPVSVPGRELKPVHPETALSFADRAMTADTAMIYPSGCSAALIRSNAGKAIGVISAEHCGLRDVSIGTPAEYSTERYTGTNGNTYLFFKNQVEVSSGNTTTTQTRFKKVTNFLLPRGTDATALNSTDQAIGVFGNVSPKEVESQYTKSVLTPKEIHKLKRGETIYMSGWPDYQPDNPGTKERQAMTMSYIGTDVVSSEAGQKTLPVIVASVKADKDGADCSYGASGSEAFIVQKKRLANGHTEYIKRVIGTQSSYYDLTGELDGTPASASALRSQLEAQYKVDLTGDNALCFISYIPPTKANGGIIDATVVNNHLEIPGFSGPIPPDDYLARSQIEYDDRVSRDRQIFASSLENQAWSILQGTVGIRVPEFGDELEDQFKWVHNPIYIQNPDGSLGLGWYDPKAPDNLGLIAIWPYADELISNAPPVSNQPNIMTLTDSYPPINRLSRLMEPFNGLLAVGNAVEYGSFVDRKGLKFGELYKKNPASNTRTLAVNLNNYGEPTPESVNDSFGGK